MAKSQPTTGSPGSIEKQTRKKYIDVKQQSEMSRHGCVLALRTSSIAVNTNAAVAGSVTAADAAAVLLVLIRLG
jgi:hypothetical protein